MTDTAPVQYFAKRREIYPRRVWGRYRKLKWVAMGVLLGIYYLAPWLRWDRGPHAPDQAILVDMANHKGYFFGIEIWPQEVYYLTGILILAAVGLFFVTSLFGRVWCGYACPQTVWTDLFIWVERIVQGDRNARMKLSKGPWTLEKIRKKGVTHALWLLIGLFTGGAWVFYFNDAPTLADHIFHLDVPWSIMVWVLGLTFSTYVMAGFAREQVCTYMCPYSRFQSAMFDKDTLVIAYDEQRGEPRGHLKKEQGKDNPWEGRGHCIDCDSCVIVCPMGIDIRNGLQMECIACGLCVDACNNVMEKVGLPKGLIRYDTEHNKQARACGSKETTVHLLRVRTFWYVAILSVVGGLMLYGLLTRSVLDLNVIHDRNPLFVTLSDGSVRNGYEVHVLNKTHDDRRYALEVRGLPGSALHIEGVGVLDAANLPVLADSVGRFRVFVSAPVQGEERREVEFVVTDAQNGNTAKTESIFLEKE